MSEKVSLYNPRDTPPEQLEAMLTGREHLLNEILDSLREQAGAPTRQHWLLRGPRGIGKTHLTGIIHHRVSTDPELSKVYLPLWLGEADVYEVYSPATLLMRIAERLVEAVPGTKLADELRTLEGTGDEDALFEDMAAHLTEESERQGRILLVLMENLDALFESFAPKQRTAQTRQLRSLLLDNPRVLFISTTPTRYLQELSNPKAPLFAHLKERRLSPLKVEEVGALFSKLAQITGRKELLGSGRDAALKQRIIHQLTGGLPRSVVMAFEILRDKEGIQPLVEDLRTFLDAQTAYFEARLSRLAARERAIVTTLALADQNLTFKEIADRSRLPEKSLSTLVSRLQQEGHLEAVDGSGGGGKGALFGLSEGLFRIWYQYRKGRLLLEPLVRFLAYWYDPSELQGVAEHMQQRLAHAGMQAGYAAKLTLIQLKAAVDLATSERGRLERQRLWDECRRAVEDATSLNASYTLESTLEQALSESINLMLSGEAEKGKAALESALAAHEPLSEKLALAITNFLVQQSNRNVQQKGIQNPEVFRLIAARFDASKHGPVRFMALFARLLLVDNLLVLGRREEALSQVDAIMALPEALHRKTSNAIFLTASVTRLSLMSDLGRKEEVLAIGRRFLDDLKHETSPYARYAVQRALFILAETYEALGRQQEQEEALLELLQSDESKLSQELRRLSAIARFKLLGIQAQDGRITSSTLPEAFIAWHEQYRDLLSTAPPDFLRILTGIHEIADAERLGRPPPVDVVKFVFQQATTVATPAVALNFLRDPAPYISNIPAKELVAWLQRLMETDLPAAQKDLLRLHLRMAELLEAMTQIPETSPRLRQKLSRVPAEFQELFKSVIAKLR
jgi:hypothetical protein